MLSSGVSKRVAPRQRLLASRWTKNVVFVLAMLPFASLVWAAWYDQLGANPAEALVRATGDWALRMLCIVLAVTPVRVVFKLPDVARFRRMLGLFAYFYVVLHLLSYSWFDMGFDVLDIVRDIVKRPFILVGFGAFVVLTALALTSFNRAIRWMGGKAWSRLHQAVYGVAGLAVLHFFWMRSGKNDFSEVAVYAVILGFLLGWRAWRYFSKNSA